VADHATMLAIQEAAIAHPAERFRLDVAAASLILLINRAPACTNRADAEQRLAELMQDLQQQTSDSRLTLEALANRVTDINAAATEFERTSDAHAYCEALDRIR
jgi:hypothetical protein